MTMKKLATLSNLIYAVACGVHVYHGTAVALPLAVLAITSGYYHYLYARQHAGLSVSTHKLQIYQRLDVASIYLVLGAYPYTLAGGLWALFFIPCAIIAMQKMMSDKPWDSHVIVPVLAIPILLLVYWNRPMYVFTGGVAFLVFAVFVSAMADYMLDRGRPDAYDRMHAWWHYATGIAFIIIT